MSSLLPNNVPSISSRNQLPLFSYFVVGLKNINPVTKLAIIEFLIYKFENPVTSSRGIAYLKNSTRFTIYEISDDIYNNGSFTHPTIRNQKNELAKYRYNQLNVINILASQSKNINQ